MCYGSQEMLAFAGVVSTRPSGIWGMAINGRHGAKYCWLPALEHPWVDDMSGHQSSATLVSGLLLSIAHCHCTQSCACSIGLVGIPCGRQHQNLQRLHHSTTVIASLIAVCDAQLRLETLKWLNYSIETSVGKSVCWWLLIGTEWRLDSGKWCVNHILCPVEPDVYL